MRPRKTVQRLVGARRGVTLPFVCIMLTALLGGIALSVDMGRVYLTAGEAQAAADAAALAGARFLQQYGGSYYPYITTSYGMGAITPLNHVAGAASQVQLSDVLPVVYDPVANTVSASSWSSTTSAVTVTVRATPRYTFAGALGLTPPSVSRKATAWIANMNGATCVRPFAFPYTRFFEAGMHQNNQDSSWTKQGATPDYSYSAVSSLQPISPWNNTPPGRTYTAIPQWAQEKVWDPPANGHPNSDGRAVTGRWTPVDFSGGGLPAYQTYVTAAPKSASCQAAAAQVGTTEAPLVPYATGLPNTSSSGSPDVNQTGLLNAMQSSMVQLCNRYGNNPNDAHCYNADGTVGVRVRVLLADSLAGPNGTYSLNTREVTMVRIMCYFQSTSDVCSPTYIRDENTPNATTPSVYWQMGGSAFTNYPAGTISVMLDGPTNTDMTSDLIFGTKPGITQRTFLVR
ncbi:MAG TPA: pilus assembly protein TadG-related protein [Gemmatirosa sp.]